jgi:hypothetical protein
LVELDAVRAVERSGLARKVVELAPEFVESLDLEQEFTLLAGVKADGYVAGMESEGRATPAPRGYGVNLRRQTS